jgi:hypothetical protein
MGEEITRTEAARLQDCEETIAAGFQTFVAVGQALLAIRDERLYRQTHATFEAYCRERWGMSRPRAYQLIEAAEVTTHLSTIVDTLPATEAQARPLTGLAPDDQRAAWQDAVATAPNGKVTAAHVAAVVRTHQGAVPHVAHNAGNTEWYTPLEYLAAARKVLGAIDLDPASSPQANVAVQARRFFTAADDGLTQTWAGRVWLNPPYASELVGRFTAKLKGHVQAGAIAAAIVLVNNATETAWFQDIASVARAICFPLGRVRFLRPDGTSGAPLQGQAVFYIGPEHAAFREAFPLDHYPELMEGRTTQRT